jgi:hypothetical protein
MHRKRSRRPDVSGIGVLAAVVGIWVVGRYVLQPGVDYLRERASTEARILWFLLVVAGAVAIVTKCIELTEGPRREADDE